MTKNPTTPTASAPETRTVQPINEAGLPDGPSLSVAPMRCTKAAVPYTEALAKERDQLRAKLNKVTAQRDELLAALKLGLEAAIVAGWDSKAMSKRHESYKQIQAAIAKAERKSLIHDPEEIEDAQIEARLDAIAEREDQPGLYDE